MQKASFFQQNSILAAAATVASHASFPETGFRPKDFRFRFELFQNWMDSFLGQNQMEARFQNTQVIRFLDAGVGHGILLRLDKKSSGPRYTMSAGGLLELLSGIAARPYYRPYESFFFAYYFVSAYRDSIEKLFRDFPSTYPPTIVTEINSLLEAQYMIERQQRFIRREIDILSSRAKESEVSADIAKQAFVGGGSLGDCVAAVEAKYPYQLNNQKPLSELFNEIPEEMRYWELTEGFRLRAHLLFEPQRAWLNSYLQVLEKLRTK